MVKKIRFPNADLHDPNGEFIDVNAVDNGDGSYSLAVNSPQMIAANISFTAATSGSGTYSANDAVHSSGSTAFEFSNVVNFDGDTGYIVKARLMVSNNAINSQFRLHLYQSPPSVIADNSPFTLLWANNATRIGSITFDALITEGAGSDCARSIMTAGMGVGNIPLPFKCAENSKSIYALLETLSALTPTATLQYYIELMVDSG
ncbi:MAG: hypothetical protein M0R06_02655 [Sphaerochaeta sp.]|nr:hypothetical protein [Sphaerochaeta sp.]